jgi:hypothetical protein
LSEKYELEEMPNIYFLNFKDMFKFFENISNEYTLEDFDGQNSIDEILNDLLLDTLGNDVKEFSINYKNWTITKRANNTFVVRDPKGQIQMETNNKGTMQEAENWVDKFNEQFLENYPQFKPAYEIIQLISYDKEPLSNQLKNITGEPFTDNYKLEGDIYTYLPTGQKFRVPIDKQEIPTNQKAELTEAIEALNLTLEFTQSKEEIKQITEAIEALEITLEFL